MNRKQMSAYIYVLFVTRNISAYMQQQCQQIVCTYSHPPFRRKSHTKTQPQPGNPKMTQLLPWRQHIGFISFANIPRTQNKTATPLPPVIRVAAPSYIHQHSSSSGTHYISDKGTLYAVVVYFSSRRAQSLVGYNAGIRVSPHQLDPGSRPSAVYRT